MTAGFIPPATWTETAVQLKTSQSVTLNAAGVGTVSFSPDHANQRWVIGGSGVPGIVVATNQAAAASVVPFCTLALNTTDITQLSAGNQRGTSWSGNNDVFSGAIDVGPCDYVSLLFYPPPGSSPAQIAVLSGVIATAIVTGTKYTRRG
jgi:hypothetical protein